MYSFVKRIFILPLLLLTILVPGACSDDSDDDKRPEPVRKTLFFYMPWSGNSSDLTSAFYKNIQSMKAAIANGGLTNERIIVFISVSASRAQMFEITYKNGMCSEEMIREYSSPMLTTAEGIAGILSDMRSAAPASSYAMVIGAHGYSWVRVEDYDAAKRQRMAPGHHDYSDGDGLDYFERLAQDGSSPLTRFFGGTETAHRTNITTLAEALDMAGMRMEYILFDVCYMSSIEVIYDLRHSADFIMACPTEIMGVGMPYNRIGRMLLGATNYSGITDEFLRFYSSYSQPYGTFAVTDCRELDSLATLMRRINAAHTFDTAYLKQLQRMDGDSPSLLYDLGDYVDHLCTDSVLANEFRAQLNRAVPYKTHTEKYPYVYGNSLQTRAIHSYCGLTTSAPSQHKLAAGVVNTSWHIDTH